MTKKQDAIAEMRAWFLGNFEDPVESCPYDSGEGGYIYIWGGPYDPQEELGGKYSATYPDKWIEELASELREQSWEWSGSSDQSDYEDEVLEQILSVTDPCQTFAGAMSDIDDLLKQNVDGFIQEKYMQLLFVNVVTALETYLSDTFIGLVNKHPKFKRNFVETCSDFQKKKLDFSQLFVEYEKIDATVNSYLLDVVWHNYGRIKPLYKGTFRIELPELDDVVHQAIHKRHDLVHRNGKTKEGGRVLVTEKDVIGASRACERFVAEVDSLIRAIEI